ncbi:hypothetical protein LOD99_6851 [Oopsacas minuta]|uniref:Beta-catenin-interacting ICAT domain-containing protein n=1 Tax=Oopsacas minuta TaxID=111878 RepID=A0AAV7JK95_9METZ|nr:hypothetical protein LOD99_6851 [Oopsacas minuta]
MAGVSGGRIETAALRQNLEDQLDRLMTQLEELEEIKGDMDQSEWEGIRNDTLEELKHFSNSLDKMLAGDMTLVDQLSSLRLATRAAISDAFKTPEVIRMFAKKQPGQLRQRLSDLERDMKFQKVSAPKFHQQKTEILSALKRLGDKITPLEEDYLSQNMNAALGLLEEVSEQIIGEDVIKVAKQQVNNDK